MNEHPITLHVMDDLRRSRLTVFFRLLLFIPHYVWLGIWSYALIVVWVLNWLVALVIGRPARPFQRFTAAFLRYSTTVYAYVLLVANPFPGFVGEPGSYPVELEVPVEPEKQNRLITFFRIFLAFPALLLAGIVTYMAFFVAFLGWWAALVLGRMPRGLRDLGANAIRYQGQASAYLYFATGRYPNSSPYVGMSLGAPVEPEAPAPEAPAEA